MQASHGLGSCRAALALSALALAAPGTAAAAIATAEARPGLTYEVLELKRVGGQDIVELRFAISNRTDGDLDLTKNGLGRIEGGGYFAGGVQLVDLPNARMFYTGSSGNRCLCSVIDRPEDRVLAAGERGEYWAWYGVPGGGLAKLAVFFPGVPPLLDVPLGQ